MTQVTQLPSLLIPPSVNLSLTHTHTHTHTACAGAGTSADFNYADIDSVIS